MKKLTLLTLAASAGLTAASQADNITLFNTGVTAANNPDGTNSTVISTNGTADPHYSVTAAPSPNTAKPNAFVVTDQGAYSAGDSNSAYINDTGSGQNSEPVGDYLYTTTFTLSPTEDPTTATISGKFGVDNGLTNIQLNGTSITGYPVADPGVGGFGGGAGGLTSFTVPVGADFVTGTNTLTFDVYNGGGGPNPTALNVTDLSGTVSAVPEPSTWVAAGGLLLLAAGDFRRRMRA